MADESGGEAGALHLVEIEAGAEEFLPGGVGGASREKIGEVMTEGGGDDELGGAPRGTSGAKPRGEVAPDELGGSRGEALQEALGNEADLNVAVIGGELSANGDSVEFGLAMKELIAGAAADGLHIHHPEVIGPDADGMESVLEGDLDFEAKGVEPDNLGSGERQVGGHEDQAAAGRMDDGDKTNHAASRSPEQIAGGPLQGDVGLAVSGTGHRLKDRIEELTQANLPTVNQRTSAHAATGRRRPLEGASVFADAGNELTARGEEPPDDFAAGIIRVGDQEHRLGQLQLSQQQQELVEERAPVAVAENEPLVNPRAEGNGVIELPDPAEEGEGLARMAHDEIGLGVGRARLMEEFDRGHLSSGLTLLQAVGEDDDPSVAPLDAGMDLQDQAGPHPCEVIGTQRRTVEEIQQAAVAA